MADRFHGNPLQSRVMGRAREHAYELDKKRRTQEKKTGRPKGKGQVHPPLTEPPLAPFAPDEPADETERPESPDTLRLRQQDRELGNIIDQLAKSRDAFAAAGPEVDLRPMSAASIIEAPPAGGGNAQSRAAARMRRRVDELEQRMRDKLLARTDCRGAESAALQLLLKAFRQVDSEDDGAINSTDLARVLARLGAISSFPPLTDESAVVDALFARHVREGDDELVYAPFARKLMRTPADNAGILDPPGGGDRPWQYSTAVKQALTRRCLGHAQPGPDGWGTREAWLPASEGSRAAEEAQRLTHVVQPINSIDGAPLRGRLPGGRKGRVAFERAAREAREATMAGRAEHDRNAARARKEYRHEFLESVRGAARGWNATLEQLREKEQQAVARQSFMGRP